MRIVTHDGTFHSDEVFAIALLKKFVAKGEVEIVRTRDNQILKEALEQKDTYVVDVGRKYQESQRNFDHHQREFKTSWRDGTLLSSCGLVWKYIRKKQFLKKYSNDILNAVEDFLIKTIDMHDNGIRTWPSVTMIASCNREENTMEDFNKAVDVALTYIENVFYERTIFIKNYKIYKEDLKQYDGGDFFYSSTMLKDSFLLKKLSNETNALVFIYQVKEQDSIRWYVKSVNRFYFEDGEKLMISALAPESWRGLSDQDLIKKTGSKGCIFVHRQGFLCGAKNKKTILMFANSMVENYYKTYN